MTPRMTVALALVGIGLATAALAGVPLLAANAVAAPTFWWVGLGVAVAGGIVALTAIRGHRDANTRVRLNRTIDVEQLQLERRSLGI